MAATLDVDLGGEDEEDDELIDLVIPAPRVTRPVTHFDREIRAGRRQAKAPVGAPGLSWWATKDRSELSAEAERRQQEMSASREGRRWRPAINDTT